MENASRERYAQTEEASVVPRMERAQLSWALQLDHRSAPNVGLNRKVLIGGEPSPT